MQQQRFSLVMDDDVSPSGEGKAKGKDRDKAGGSSREKGKGRAGKAVRQREGGDAWESDEEERAAKRRKEEERYARDQPRDGEGAEEVDEAELLTPQEKAERARLADLAERDAFASRMKDKDKDKTKGLVEDRSTKLDPDSAARRALAKDPGAFEQAMPSLRERSRQSYLGKREQQQLDLLRIEIADDERDYKGVNITKRERDELNRKKELLRLAEERLAIDEGLDGYQMPDGQSSRHALKWSSAG